MKFIDTKIKDCYRIELERRGDDRGFFARLFCKDEFRCAGYNFDVAQANDSFSAEKGTLRGMHFQLGDSSETKVIRCLKGSIFDVVIDLRPHSKSFMSWAGFKLDESNRSMVLVPKGCAHGFLTLEPNTEVFYLVDANYEPEMERGVRWNDPRFSVEWPIEPVVISEKDQQWELFRD